MIKRCDIPGLYEERASFDALSILVNADTERERERRIRNEGKMGRDLQKAILIAVVWREQRRVNTRELEFF